MKRKYREAMRAAARERNESADDEALETRNWFDEWTMSAKPLQPDEQPESQKHN